MDQVKDDIEEKGVDLTNSVRYQNPMNRVIHQSLQLDNIRKWLNKPGFRFAGFILIIMQSIMLFCGLSLWLYGWVVPAFQALKDRVHTLNSEIETAVEIPEKISLALTIAVYAVATATMAVVGLPLFGLMRITTLMEERGVGVVLAITAASVACIALITYVLIELGLFWSLVLIVASVVAARFLYLKAAA